uniref:Uncharacterized protein n=1 Tax=Thermogemmatispora argillosa TaxID=2045280 RepID=A0A455SVU4_9CHLR|nr:hypothetical protein KTA_06860 [Thermogemmatispora argillosa]
MRGMSTADGVPAAGLWPESAQAASELSPALHAEAVLGLLSYLGGWLSGLLVLLFGGKSRLVRFHALQSLFFFGLLMIIDIFMLMIPVYASRFSSWWGLHDYDLEVLAALSWLLLLGTLQVVTITGWLIGMIQAARRRVYLMPLVGRLALLLAGGQTYSARLK